MAYQSYPREINPRFAKSEPLTYEEMVVRETARIGQLILEISEKINIGALLRLEGALRSLDSTLFPIWKDHKDFENFRKNLLEARLTEKRLKNPGNRYSYYLDLINWRTQLIWTCYPRLNLIPAEDGEAFSGDG